jgi:hypothetical protein
MNKKWVYAGNYVRLQPNLATVTPIIWRLDNIERYSGRTTDANLSKSRESLELSPQSRKKLTAAINWLYAAARKKQVFDKETGKKVAFRVNFITLTIPTTHGQTNLHELAPSMLNSWLSYMRIKQGLQNYVWKLEFTKNNVIHYHITTDTYLHWRTVRNVWNYQLKEAGCLSVFKEKYGHYDANSTDIHATKHVRNFCAYMIKYVCKSAASSLLPAGRLWSCSQRISKAIATRLEVLFENAQADVNDFINSKIEHIEICSVDKITGAKRVIGDMFKPSTWGWKGCLQGYFSQFYQSMIGFLQSGNEQLIKTYAN